MRRRWLLSLAVFPLASLGLLSIRTPVAGATQAMPPNIWSYYVETTPACSTDYFNEGYELGQHDLSEGTNYHAQDLVIIDWGRLWFSGGYGTKDWVTVNGTFVPGSTIENCTEQFAKGYFGGTGANSVAHLRIAIGTNNEQDANGWPSSQAGVAFGGFANTVWDWVYNSGYSSQVDVAGAYDAELAFDVYPQTLSFENGWNSATTGDIYDFGDAGGCPPAGSCQNGWTVSDVGSVAYAGGADQLPVPEIYNNSNALQWANVAVNGGVVSNIAGVMTQSNACAQKGGCTSPCCTNNTPTQGWDELSNALGVTYSQMTFSTDICWFKQTPCT